MNILKKYFSIFLKHAAPLGLFVLIPLMVILYLGHNIITSEKDKHFYELSTKIDYTLKDIENEVTPESFLLKVGRGAWFSFNQNPDDLTKYWDYYRTLCDFLQDTPDLYVFDENGSLITPQKINLKSRFLATKLWNSMFSDYQGKTNFTIKYYKQLRSFLGNEFKLGQFLECRNNLMPMISNSKKGYIYWMNSDENNKKGILLIFWNIPSYELRINNVINRYFSFFNDIFIKRPDGQIHSFAKKNYRLEDSVYDNIYLRTALIDPPEGFLDYRSILWKPIKLENSWLIGGVKSKNKLFEKYYNSFIYSVFLIAIIIVFIYFWTIKSKSYYISIRIKLITLFLIAVITPVLGFSYLGYQYVTDTKENLITEISNESRDILLNIDSELGRSGIIFLDDFRKIAKDFQNYENDEHIRKKFEDGLAKQDFAVLDRRIASDASRIRHITNLVLVENMNQVIESFAKCCIDTRFNTNLMETIDPGLRSAMNSPETGLSTFWTRPDTVQDIVMGAFEYYLYWCFTNSNDRTEFILIMRMKEKVLHELLHKRIEQCKTNPKEKNYIILARNDNNGEWIPNNNISNELKDVSRRLNFMGKPIESQIVIDSKFYLLMATKSFKVKGYSFYALYPYSIINDKLIVISRIIAAFILFFIVMTLAIAYQLSGSFLHPVKCLEEGVKAIKERKSDFRIEALQNDEFGGLAESFNKMIGDLKEMELAKYIQESLLPKSLPKIKGYQLSFSNRMASAIGGDYFDIKLLDEDNLCIIIGDVSGHGVASALVMAIAKAVIYHGFKQTRDLILLFNNLNSVINTYFSKPPVKKMITLFATIVNLSTGKATFFDAGHNFPMKISKDGQITELKMTGFPVGTQKKIRKKNTEEYTINEGETVVFYTDGIIEATGKTTEQYGYDRFKNSLTKMVNDSSDTMINTLFKNYEIWEDDTEPDDDVTLFILKRLALQKDKSSIVS